MDPPQILVTFPNGHQDEFVFKPNPMGKSTIKTCPVTYTGHLLNSPSSRVAVTGCMKKPGDQIEITMISEHSGTKLFIVDFFGNAEPIEIPQPHPLKTTGKKIYTDYSFSLI